MQHQIPQECPRILKWTASTGASRLRYATHIYDPFRKILRIFLKGRYACLRYAAHIYDPFRKILRIFKRTHQDIIDMLTHINNAYACAKARKSTIYKKLTFLTRKRVYCYYYYYYCDHCYEIYKCMCRGYFK